MDGNFTAPVVAFDLNARDIESLRCVAEETGGEMLAASDAAGLAEVITTWR
jgi:hypothetical protein